MIRILVADNSSLIRERVRKIIEKTPDLVVGDEASDGAEAITKAIGGHFDVVLLDISLPGVSGLDVLTVLRAKKPKLPILMLSIYKEREYLDRSIEQGASGYLTKNNASNELVNAVRMISAGDKYLNHT